MQNRENKKLAQKQRTLSSPRISIAIGLGWTIVLMFLLVKVDKSNSTINSAFFQIPLFYIGSLLISYGIVRSTKRTADETSAHQWMRITLFAAGASLASLIAYSWLYLFVNGL
jgi:hypothetical protein